MHQDLTALAEAALPSGRILLGGGGATATATLAFLGGRPEPAQRAYRALLGALAAWSRLRTGLPFYELPVVRRLALLSEWEATSAGRLALRGLLTPLKLVHFGAPGPLSLLGCEPPPLAPALERPRWLSQVSDAGTLSDGEEIECDVVVVGTGAGGAACAHALAARGHAVLLVEEGGYHSRAEFTGQPVPMMEKLYRNGGATFALGNTVIPIPLGRGVGGTTLINSGTCFRVPENVLEGWRTDAGLSEFTPSLLAPYYDIVERELGVGVSPPSILGRQAERMAAGADALGFSHAPLARNAPGCDGQGVCCFGCPTDAKRSTNVSFVPSALMLGAQLLTGFKVENVLLDDETAVGVVGGASDASGRALRIRVRAQVVVLACGALHTPLLLLRQGIANASGELGKNLSIHPAVAAIARFDEEVNSARAVPQGYSIDHFASEGLVFEGAQVPLDLTAASLPGHGPEFVHFMEKWRQLLTFGFMVKDSSRGRVHRTSQGEPRTTYFLNDRDLALVQRGLGILSRVFFAAGAREVRVPVSGVAPLYGLSDVERLEKAKLSPRQIDLSAYHPLGTARMGRNPLSSVVASTHESHDVHNLFICDGSAVPGALGVNPQVTIMAMARRGAEYIDRRLSRMGRDGAA